MRPSPSNNPQAVTVPELTQNAEASSPPPTTTTRTTPYQGARGRAPLRSRGRGPIRAPCRDHAPSRSRIVVDNVVEFREGMQCPLCPGFIIESTQGFTSHWMMKHMANVPLVKCAFGDFCTPKDRAPRKFKAHWGRSHHGIPLTSQCAINCVNTEVPVPARGLIISPSMAEALRRRLNAMLAVEPYSVRGAPESQQPPSIGPFSAEEIRKTREIREANAKREERELCSMGHSNTAPVFRSEPGSSMPQLAPPSHPQTPSHQVCVLETSPVPIEHTTPTGYRPDPSTFLSVLERDASAVSDWASAARLECQNQVTQAYNQGFEDGLATRQEELAQALKRVQALETELLTLKFRH